MFLIGVLYVMERCADCGRPIPDKESFVVGWDHVHLCGECYYLRKDRGNGDELRELKTAVLHATGEYNRYHSPEVTAKLVSINRASFKVGFTGSFCDTCGFHDYFDDYTILLGKKGLKAVIGEIVETEEGAVVAFEVSQRSDEVLLREGNPH